MSKRNKRELRPDPRNANRGTERGVGQLDHSLRTYGAGRSILATRDGIVIAGNKTLERAVDLGIPIREVETDGRELIAVVRSDIDGADAVAVALGIADNRCSETGLDWDVDMLEKLGEDIDLSEFWHDGELAEILGVATDDSEQAEVDSGCVQYGEKSYDAVPESSRKLPLAELMDTKENISVQFSGGKDSVATLLWCLENCNRAKVTGVYIDTGIDFPFIRSYIRYVEEKTGCVIDIRGESDDTKWIELLHEFGFPHFSNLWCHDRLKLIHWKAYFHETDKTPDNTVLAVGVRQEESARRAAYHDRGIDPRGFLNAHPVLDFGEKEIKDILARWDVKLSPVYLYADRSGCFCCPNAPGWTWRSLREKHPHLWIKSMMYLREAADNMEFRDKYVLDHILKAMSRDTKDITPYSDVALTEDAIEGV